jgi:protein O-GlcNAc transferase
MDRLFQQATRLHAAGKLPAAINVYRSVVAQQPHHRGAAVNYGVALFQSGKVQEGLRVLQTGVTAFPDYVDAHYNLGYALYRVQRYNEAVPCFTAALQLNANHFQAHLHLGNSYRVKGDLESAFQHYLKGYKLKSDSLELLNNWTVVCIRLHQYDQAAKILERTRKHFPDRPEMLANEALIAKHKGAYDKAESFLMEALQKAPANGQIMNELGILNQEINRMEKALYWFQRVLEKEPTHARVHSNILYLQNYHPDISNRAHRDSHLAWQQTHAPASLVKPYAFPKHSPDRPLRVGLLSGDFCRHPVAVFLLAWLGKVAPEEIIFYGYAEVRTRDDYTPLFQQLCAGWFETNGVADEAVADKIAADGVDILVDLSGHTQGNRLTVMGYRPAPVQVAYLGYINTTGLPQMDYRVVDALVSPPEQQPYYSEKFAYLPDSYTCYQPPEFNLPVSPTPALANGYVTLGCFNNPSKINRAVVSCWSHILDQLPEAKLLLKSRQLKSPAGRAVIEALFKDCRVNPEQVVYEGASHYEEYFRAYARIDLALDPFPHNGGTTTHDALYMGVPVVSKSGERYVSRMGTSILTNLGHPEWVAQDEEDYISKVVERVQDVEQLNTIRKGLRAKMLSSPLCAATTFANNFTQLMRALHSAV